MIVMIIYPLKCFFGIEGHAALDIIPGPGGRFLKNLTSVLGPKPIRLTLSYV